mmetsp:Transcript_22799/g.50392  ORF Transcript_22799/g.50392 Transcript_22799/m.50392 type:complete len:399 (+) Transcript_22799:36-1232(+)
MHRGGMGLDRGSHSGSAGGQGFRRDQHRGYRPNEHSGYGSNSGVQDNAKYDHNSVKYEGHNSKYENGAKYERTLDEAPGDSGYSPNGTGRNGYGASGGGTGGTGGQHQVPQAMVASLEKRICAVQADMNQALHEVTGKDNEKFDLIFSILTELQRRQAQLEESVRGLKAQFDPMNGSAGQYQQHQQQQQQQQQQQHAQGQSSPTSQQNQAAGSPDDGSGRPSSPSFGPMSNQMASQMGNQMCGQMGNQMGNEMGNQMGSYMGMPMGQQFNCMMSADGSQAYFAPVVMGVPPNGMHMAYCMPQMMPQGAGHMPQQMVLVNQGQCQAEGDFQQQHHQQHQWGEASPSGDSATRSSSKVAAADAAPGGGQSQEEQPGTPAPEGDSPGMDGSPEVETCKAEE